MISGQVVASVGSGGLDGEMNDASLEFWISAHRKRVDDLMKRRKNMPPPHSL